MKQLRNPVTLVCLAAAFAACSRPCPAQTQAIRDTTSAQALGLTELTDDLSRQDLFGEIAKAEPSTAGNAEQDFNLYGPFRFPGDARFDQAAGILRKDSLFGIDISHHTNINFPIELLHQRQVLFLYMKATQSTGFIDTTFATFWARAGALPKATAVHRGAYHFLSSTNPQVPQAQWNDDEARAFGVKQASTFVKVVLANGGLLATDMPPVVDLEWDKASKEAPDRWAQRTPSQTLALLQGFLVEVEAKLHRTPVIYTAQAWCQERKMEKAVAGIKYLLWLADYSKVSQLSEKPRAFATRTSSLWQFTEKAEMAIGFNGTFDANIYKGKEEEFYTLLGVARF